jgi:hypothetical protein
MCAQPTCGSKGKLPVRIFCWVMLVAVPASSALAQAPPTPEQKPTMEELLQRIDALQRRAADGDKVIDALKHRVTSLSCANRRSARSRRWHPARVRRHGSASSAATQLRKADFGRLSAVQKTE